MSVGTHASHCCVKHGCKYGSDSCPVVSGEVAMELDQCQEGWDMEEPCKNKKMNAIVDGTPFAFDVERIDVKYGALIIDRPDGTRSIVSQGLWREAYTEFTE